MTEESESLPLQPNKSQLGDAADEERRRPVQWTSRLQRLTAVLSGLVDASAMAHAAVEHARAALDSESGVLFLLTADRQSVEITHASGFPDRAVGPWARFPVSAPVPATEAIRMRRAVLVRSREELLAHYPDLARTPGALDYPSLAAVPLVVEGDCIGALGLAFNEARTLEQEEVDFLRVIADQCAQALRRALLTERERRSSARLRTLAEASRMLAAANPDVGSVLDAISTEVLAHVGQSCSISLASPDGEWLEVVSIRDTDPDREQRRRGLASTLRIRRGEGLSGRALATGESILLPSLAPHEIAEQTVPAAANQVVSLAARSLLIVPLKTSGRTLGTIGTARYEGDAPFTDDDRTLLEDLADRAALAVENARLHENEREARARAEDADRRKDEFLAMLGHELRNPLAPISTAVEIMRQLPVEDERFLWARDAIARQATQLARLVDDLLDISRINLGKIELRLEPLDLGSVALQALEASRPLLSERNHQVSVDLPATPARVHGDAARLTQVISNLLNNAAKYTDPGGHVRLWVAPAGGEAVVTVSDTGIGIAHDMLGRVFDLFAQAEDARERAQGGIGIGLTLVKRLVEMHGGSVHASSPGVGHGSSFELRLPLAEAPLGTEAGAPQAHGRPHAARRVLIADDNADAAEGLRQLLELQDHEIVVVHDGVAAVEAVSRFDPEVVLLDISLPRVDGLEAARQIRARAGAHRPLLIAITGLGRAEDRQRSAEAGFDHHLVKPIDLPVLEALVARGRG